MQLTANFRNFKWISYNNKTIFASLHINKQDICISSYTLFCGTFYKLRYVRAVIGAELRKVRSLVQVSLLATFFFLPPSQAQVKLPLLHHPPVILCCVLDFHSSVAEWRHKYHSLLCVRTISRLLGSPVLSLSHPPFWYTPSILFHFHSPTLPHKPCNPINVTPTSLYSS